MIFKSTKQLTPRKDPIPNQDSDRIITQQHSILPPHLTKIPTGNKPFIDDTHFLDRTENERY